MTDIFKIVNWLRVASRAQIRLYAADELTRVKAIKLLYYVQGTYLSMYCRRAFMNDIVAGEDGPTIDAVIQKYAHQTTIVGQITQHDLNDYNSIAEDSELGQVLNAVWQAFGDMSSIQLLKKSRAERPWTETTLGQVIPLDLMASYFTREIVKQ
jgi:uncharacterized phage-associated protein